MRRSIWLALFLVIGGLLGQAHAASVAVTAANYTGSRSTSSGVTATGLWAISGLMLSWNITYDNATKLFTYKYTISDDSGKTYPVQCTQVDYLDIEVSPSYTAANTKAGSSAVTAPSNFSSSGLLGSTPYMPASGLHGVQFGLNSTLPTYTLVTDRAPIWGDFYVKGDTTLYVLGNVAWNKGFGTDPTAATTNFTNWIPTPDTIAVPVPAGVLTGGATLLGMAGLTLYRRRRQLA
ncbi:MAG: hypothetical protein NTW19_22365 [Planctomycetota bacterium]|nr:hypothetical protein [Planctomycetota bacterium]